MLTKEMFKIATKIDDLYVIYMGSLDDKYRDIAFQLYEMCNGNVAYMEELLDLAVDNFVKEDKIVQFFTDAINGTEIIIDDDGNYIGYKEPHNN